MKMSSNVLCLVVLVVGSLSVRVMAQAVLPRNGATQAAGAQLASSESSSVNAPDAPVVRSAVVVVEPAPVQKNARQGDRRVLPFSRIAVNIQVGTLGVGGQIATPLTRRLNLRGGVNLFNFGYGLGVDGANYQGEAHLKSGQVSIDYFPFHSGFHISPGFLIFKSAFSASMNVPKGNSFDLGDSTYTSSATDPVNGNASLLFTHTIMPSFTFGFSNMIAREGRHWSVPFEMGAAYTGHYSTQLNLLGTTCVSEGCMSTSDPTFQRSVVEEQNTLNESMKHYQIYPIVTTGVSYRF